MKQTFKNKIINTATSQIIKIKEEAQKNNFFIAEIDGATIHSWQEYATTIGKIFKFPNPCTDSIDRYLDWMRDLDWLRKDGYALIIYNYGTLLHNAPQLAHEIVEDFKVAILPFWQEEVTHVVVEGKPKPFIVYLVD